MLNSHGQDCGGSSGGFCFEGVEGVELPTSTFQPVASLQGQFLAIGQSFFKPALRCELFFFPSSPQSFWP
jgi:hypothetical protein